MRIVVCYPLLDLRFLIDPRDAPPPPRWQIAEFAYATVGTLGKVLSFARGGDDGEVKINAAFLFEPEYDRPASGGKRWQEAPGLDGGLTVASRRLLADVRGHLRIEVVLEHHDDEAEPLVDLLDRLLALPVDIPRRGPAELVTAGFEFTRLYLQQSAKTAGEADPQPIDILVREGKGSPFLVLLRDGAPDESVAGVWLDPAPARFPRVSFHLMELAGHTLGVWQLWHADDVSDWAGHVRTLCQTICYLSEVTLLVSLQDEQAIAPLHFNAAATESFLRTRAGQLKRRKHGIWPLPAVQALADKHIRVSIEEEQTFHQSLLTLRRDLASDLAKSLDGIRSRSVEHSVPTLKSAPGRPAAPPPRTSVFISYSHADAPWLERLKRHLKPLVRDGVLDCWDDSRIRPGDDWRGEIRTALERAQAAVLLISADFYASDFIATDELPPLLSAAEARGIRILPLIVSPSRYARDAKLACFQSINPPDNPLIELSVAEQEEFLDRLAQHVETALGG